MGIRFNFIFLKYWFQIMPNLNFLRFVCACYVTSEWIQYLN